MKKIKMSLVNIQSKLSKIEQRNIMAGSAGGSCAGCLCDLDRHDATSNNNKATSSAD